MTFFNMMHSAMKRGNRLCCEYQRLDAHFTGKKVKGITVKNDLRCGWNWCLWMSGWNRRCKLVEFPFLFFFFLRITFSGHVKVLGHQQQSLDVGSRVGALQGQKVRHVHVGQSVGRRDSGGSTGHCHRECLSWGGSRGGGALGHQPHLSDPGWGFGQVARRAGR